jgi:hypothetical protein
MNDIRPGSRAWDPQRESHAQWKRERILYLQRVRRRHNPRIDYYPSKEAEAMINSLRAPRAGGDASSILDRIVAEWSALHGVECRSRSPSCALRNASGS